MKPSDKQLAAGVKAFNECDIVSTPHCISAAYDAMSEVMTVDDVPERVRREIEANALLNAGAMIPAWDCSCDSWLNIEAGKVRGGK